MSQRFTENAADDAVDIRTDSTLHYLETGARPPSGGMGKPLPRFIRALGIHPNTRTLCYDPNEGYFFHSRHEEIWNAEDRRCSYTGTYRRLNSFFADEKYRCVFRGITRDDAVDLSMWNNRGYYYVIDAGDEDPKFVWRWQDWLNTPRVEIRRLNLFLAAVGEPLINVDSVSPSEVRKTIKEYEKRYPQYRACG